MNSSAFSHLVSKHCRRCNICGAATWSLPNLSFTSTKSLMALDHSRLSSFTLNRTYLTVLDHGIWPFFTLNIMFAYGATRGLDLAGTTFQHIAIWSLSIVEGAIDMEVLIEYSHIFPSSLPSLWQPFGVLYPSFTCNMLTSRHIRGTRIRLSL